MIKKAILFLMYFVFFVLALIYFTPKSSVYFLLEEELQKQNIVISSEKVSDGGFVFKIKHADISVKSIKSANIQETTLKIFAIYNSLNLKKIVLSDAFKSFVPLHVYNAEIVYSIIDPLDIKIRAVGKFGKLKANFNIIKNHLHLNLKPSNVMIKKYKSTLKNFTKIKNGEFAYDKTF